MSKRVGLRHVQTLVVGGVVLYPAAWNYDNLVGDIWLEGIGHNGYDTAPTGQIEVREPIGIDELGEIQGGYYDNR